MGAVFSVDECYSALPDSSQRANELAGWRSRWLELSGQFQAPAVLPPSKEPPVSIW
jgi:hypothetical protein